MDGYMSARSRRIAAYASVLLLVFSWVLALGLVGMGLANRRSVRHTAEAALRGRALDRAVTAAGTLALLRPAGPARLQQTFEELVDDRILQAWLVTGNGVVVAASDREARGKVLPEGVRRRMQECRGEHLIRKVGPGRYEVWLPIRRSGPGWRRWRRMWRWWRSHHGSGAENQAGRQGGDCPMGALCPARDGAPPWGGGRGRMRGLGRRWMPGPMSPDQGPGSWEPPAPPPPDRRPGAALVARALALGELPYLRFVVAVDDAAIEAALRRSKAVSVVSIIVALLLMLGSALVFFADRRNRALQAELVQHRHLAEIGELAAVLAHEIRNPLGVMKGNAQVAAERLGAGAPEELELIVEQSSRLERLVNALLDYARPTEPRRRLVDLADLAARTAEMMAQQAMDKGVLLVTDLDPVQAMVDPDQIQQVLINLLDNALDVSTETVTLSVKKSADHALVAVEDRGPGIPGEIRDKLFRPFVTTKAKGTGLGLAIARRIVQAHSGEIRAVNGARKGARFEVTLPLGQS